MTTPTKEDLDRVYEERNRVVGLAAHLAICLGWRAGVSKHKDVPGEDWDPEWRTVVFVDLPTGQVTWHVHDSQIHLFEHLPPYPDHLLAVEARHGVESFTKEDRSFDCVNCAQRFTPEKEQWIFYNLCNDCYVSFDSQKMIARMAFINGTPQPEETRGTESVHEWMRRQKAAGKE